MNFTRKISKTEYLAHVAAGLLIFLLIWLALTHKGFIKPLFLPAPWTVVKALAALWSSGSLIADTWASLYRILLGCLASFAIALPLGVMLGVYRRAEALVEPLIAFIRYIPPSAFIPLAIIWLGIGEAEKILILVLGVAPYLTLLISDTVIATRRDLVDAALTLGARPADVILRVILPNSMPAIWDSFRIMIGAAWTFVITAEIVGASSGLGHLMIQSQRFLRTDNIFAGIIVIGLLGLATDYSFKLTYKIFFPWTEKSHA